MKQHIVLLGSIFSFFFLTEKRLNNLKSGNRYESRTKVEHQNRKLRFDHLVKLVVLELSFESMGNFEAATVIAAVGLIV